MRDTALSRLHGWLLFFIHKADIQELSLACLAASFISLPLFSRFCSTTAAHSSPLLLHGRSSLFWQLVPTFSFFIFIYLFIYFLFCTAEHSHVKKKQNGREERRAARDVASSAKVTAWLLRQKKKSAGAKSVDNLNYISHHNPRARLNQHRLFLLDGWKVLEGKRTKRNEEKYTQQAKGHSK